MPKLEQPQRVTVEVFDMPGRSVAMLHDGLLRGGETHTFTIDGDGLVVSTSIASPESAS